MLPVATARSNPASLRFGSGFSLRYTTSLTISPRRLFRCADNCAKWNRPAAFIFCRAVAG